MMRFTRYLLFLKFIFLSVVLLAQTKADLKKQKSAIEKEIRYTSKLLNQTKHNKTKSLNYLKVLDSQIKSKEKLLINYKIEISLFNKQINTTELFISKIDEGIREDELNLTNLKEEYAKMIYSYFKKKGNSNDIVFILSSSDFNQAYKRIIYLKQYSDFRKNQAIRIATSQKKLIKKKEKLAQQRDMLIEETANKMLLISSKRDEIEGVNIAKNTKEALLKKLRSSEELFKKQLIVKHKKARMLDDKIRKIIEEEIIKTKKKNMNGSYNITPEALTLSSDFTSNKGKLPWPLEKGVIVSSYGKQKHIIFAGVETFNNGVDIATDKNTDVRVIFDGTVSRIFFIKGEGKAILINHGEYFSVYSGLKEVKVKAGEKLLSKEKIGVVLTHEVDNKTQLHFEIWKGYEKLDPSIWLYNAY
jgi:septal ring factor EnvC (AmiA/AmiB activator)